jgi:hypothetical protein
MRRICTLFLLLAGLGTAMAGTGRVVKVLPHYLDARGRHALDPSLYERDAYQAFLRDHPERIQGIRFDVQWKGRDVDETNLKLRVELRGAREDRIERHVLERPVRRDRWFASWSALELTGEEFEQLGTMLAWRASLWEGDRMLASQESFLWSVASEDLPEPPSARPQSQPGNQSAP